jgi:hypothetical protein
MICGRFFDIMRQTGDDRIPRHRWIAMPPPESLDDAECHLRNILRLQGCPRMLLYGVSVRGVLDHGGPEVMPLVDRSATA